MRKLVIRLFIVTGILMILGAAGLTVCNLYDAYRAGEDSQEILDQMEDRQIPDDSGSDQIRTESDPDSTSSDTTGVSSLYEQYPEMVMPAVKIKEYRYIAVLQIPEIGLKLPVMEEWDYDRLKISPCRYSGSIYTHDIVIAGHNYARHFSPIKRLGAGTEVILTDMSGNVFRYRIAYTEILNPGEVEALKTKSDGDTWDLSLFTCTPGGSSRFVARCSLE